jgi:6,7-dimethyl-8-ribityllumazine synthase
MLIQGDLTVKPQWRIGVVTSRFNSEITESLEKGAIDRLIELGVSQSSIRRIRVPGAVEIPLVIQKLLDGECDGAIALGAVIRGETAHFDYVCNAVERGCTEVMLKTKKPVVFGVLTTDTEEQAKDRIGGAHGHKGRDAAEVVIEMLDLMDRL